MGLGKVYFSLRTEILSWPCVLRGTWERVAAKGESSGDGSGEKEPTSSSSARTKLDTVSRSKAVSPLCACANPVSAWQARVKS